MIHIQPMNQSHIPQIVALEELCFSDPWSENAFFSELQNPLSLWLVAEDENHTVAGYIGSQTVIDASDIMNVAVAPQYRNHGIATALIDRLCAQLIKQGALSVALEVRCTNLPAISLYNKLGFEQVGVRRNYYRNPREDALILRKEIR